jgi:hypothetical protein
MAGDVNLYWNDHDDPNTAEIEVMVAEGRSRRKGLAAEALTLFMGYAVTELVRRIMGLNVHSGLTLICFAPPFPDCIAERDEVQGQDW